MNLERERLAGFEKQTHYFYYLFNFGEDSLIKSYDFSQNKIKLSENSKLNLNLMIKPVP